MKIYGITEAGFNLSNVSDRCKNYNPSKKKRQEKENISERKLHLIPNQIHNRIVKVSDKNLFHSAFQLINFLNKQQRQLCVVRGNHILLYSY